MKTILFTAGRYSSYQIYGMRSVPDTFDIAVTFREWQAQHPEFVKKQDDGQTYCDITAFLQWVRSTNGPGVPVAYTEVHCGVYDAPHEWISEKAITCAS